MLLEQIEELGTTELRDVLVFRHMLADIPPSRINTRGARWNPPEVGAIYTSFSRETALAEASYHLSLQTPPLRVKRTIYSIRVTLHRVTAIQDVETLTRLNVRMDTLITCQRIGGAVARLGHDGLIVPSARHRGGMNLVIFPAQNDIEITGFDIVGSEIFADERG
jgi:RES domain-containing protein